MSRAPLERIQGRLRGTCHVFLRHDPLYDDHPWKAGVETEHNQWPYWIVFRGPTPAAALALLEGFFAGTVPDHANNPRPPSAFLAEPGH